MSYAEELARRGASLVLSSRREGELAAVAARCTALGAAAAHVLPLDALDVDAHAPAVAAAAALLGGAAPDVLVLNAGRSQRLLALEVIGARVGQTASLFVPSRADPDGRRVISHVVRRSVERVAVSRTTATAPRSTAARRA